MNAVKNRTSLTRAAASKSKKAGGKPRTAAQPAASLEKRIKALGHTDREIASLTSSIDELDGQAQAIQAQLKVINRAREQMISRATMLKELTRGLEPANFAKDLQLLSSSQVVKRCLDMLISPLPASRRQVALILSSVRASIFLEIKETAWREARKKAGRNAKANDLRDRYGSLLGLAIDESMRRPGAQPPRRGRRPNTGIEARSRQALLSQARSGQP